MTIFQNVIIFFLAIATFSELQPHNLVMLFYISRCDFISLSYNFGSRNLLIYTLYIPQSEFKSRNVALFFLLYRFFPPELLLYLTIWRYISQFCFISCSVHLFFIKKKITICSFMSPMVTSYPKIHHCDYFSLSRLYILQMRRYLTVWLYFIVLNFIAKLPILNLTVTIIVWNTKVSLFSNL